MPGPFDGMSGIIAGVFGDVVVIYPGGGSAQEVQAIFRENPIQTGDAFGEGGFWTSAPSLKVKATEAEGLGSGDRVDADGRIWRILNRVPGGSPAADRFLMFELEIHPNP